MQILIRVLLALYLLLLPNTALAEWREATSENFVVVSGGSEAELVRLSQQLEAVHWMMAQATRANTSENRTRVRIYLVDDVGDVRRAMGARSNSLVAGFYRSDIEGPIAVVPRRYNDGLEPSVILFHEYAHHFMLQYMNGSYPAWFVEGFAEMVSTASFETAGHISYGRPAQHRRYELGRDNWINLEEVFARPTANGRQNSRSNYAQYWVLAHYLTFAEARRGELREFLTRRAQGRPDEEAFQAFTGGLRQLNRDAQTYMTRGVYTFVRPALPPEVMRAPTVRMLSAGETANIDNELQAGRYHDSTSLAALLTDVAADATQFPNDLSIALTHIRMLIEADRFGPARQEAERALALSPQNPRALAYRGWTMLLERAEAGSAIDAAVVRQARQFIARGNRADTEDAVPLYAYYQSFRLAGEEAPQLALEGLYRASRLVPQQPGLRMQVAQELIERRQLQPAQLLLEPLAFAPHESQLQRYALQLVDWIRSGGEGERPTPTRESLTEAEE